MHVFIWRFSVLIFASQCQASHYFDYLKVHLADHTLSFMLPWCMCWYSRMSLQILNAENGENGGNVNDDLTAEDCGFFFAPPEPTGRPSILRLSQKENLPPKSVAKAMKVNFWFIISPLIVATCAIWSLKILWCSCSSFFFFLAAFLKVTFQTPLRDPQTRKILSPTMTDKLDATFTLDDCSDALEDDILSASFNVE